MEIPKRPLTFEEVLEKYGNTQVYFCYNCWTSSTLRKQKPCTIASWANP